MNIIIENNKIYILLLLTLVCILSISAISASENTTDKDIISSDNNKENNLKTNIQYDDVITSKENDELNLEETNNDEEDKSGKDKTTTLNEETLTFRDLNRTINGNTNSTIYLSNNYQYNEYLDHGFTHGIQISRDLTIYGNGVTLNANNISSIFTLTDLNLNVKFYNLNFIKGLSYEGGIVYGGNAYNCTFKENYEAALHSGNAYNCTFIENHYGALRSGNAYNCTFIENDGGSIYDGTAYNCTFTGNNHGYQMSGAIDKGEAYNCIFTGTIGTTIYHGTAYNCTFTENMGPCIEGGDAYNCTFTGNNAISGAGIDGGTAYNCIFTGNNADNYGGAILRGKSINCIFIGNKAKYGGALAMVTATNCTFSENIAEFGGAMFEGSATLCLFNNDTTLNTTIIPITINVLNYTSKYQSGERLKFNLTAEDMLLDGFNTTIEIYKDGSLVTTVYGLTGEGWIVDLIPGEYTAVLSLTDYPDEKSSNATITVLKGDTAVVINPIIDVKVGQEITITYNTISNGTATIKVNGQTITDGKFTPTTASTYNVTVEIAESEYYNAVTNETTFTAKKNNTTITINPLINIIVGKEIKITYKTNSNGTATIKVNDQAITDGKFTPTTIGTYNVTVEIAENEYYNGATNQSSFIVKLASKITAKPVSTVYNVGKNLIIILKDQNGKAIKGAILTVNLAGTKKYTTDGKGQVKINIAKLTPKTYTAKITYRGSDTLNASTASVKVTVKKATPKITAKQASYKLKLRTKKYTAIFKDNKNKALKNTKVSLKVNGKNYITKTNNKGQAIFKITNLKKKGKYTAVITIPTNKYYNKLSKKVKITVKQ